MPPIAPLPRAQMPNHGKRLKWITVAIAVLLGVAAIVIALLSIALNFNSQKALFDATEYALKTPGTYHVKARGLDLTLTSNTYKYELAGNIDGTSIDTIIDSAMIYLKSSDPQSVFHLFVSGESGGLPSGAIDHALAALKNKWVVLDLTNPPFQSAALSTVSCAETSIDELTHDPTAWTEVSQLFFINPIFSISKKDRTKYVTTYDDTKTKGFYEGLIKTRIYNNISACSDSITPDSMRKMKGLAATLTLEEPSHVPFSIITKDASGQLITIMPNYKNVPKVVIPTDTIGVDQIARSFMRSLLSHK